MQFCSFLAVLDIDTLGTFNVSKTVYNKFFKVLMIKWIINLIDYFSAQDYSESCRVCSVGMIWVRISNNIQGESYHIKGTIESSLVKDSLVHLMYQWSQITDPDPDHPKGSYVPVHSFLYFLWVQKNGGGSIINITATLHYNGTPFQVCGWIFSGSGS